MEKVSFFTLGCKVNQYETEAMEEEFERQGYLIAADNDIADIYVVNTCTVTNLSDRKSRQFISKAKNNNPNALIAVVGCYAQVAPDKIKEIDGVDVIIGTREKSKIVDLCKEASDAGKQINIVKDIRREKQFEGIRIDKISDKTRANIKIQDGCNQFCSFCIIPYARGPIRSRGLEDIILEADRLANVGYKEVVLTGIHVSSYGKDTGEGDLATVISKIAEIEGIERIRLSSIEQSIISHKFFEKIMKNDKLCHHFHLSLQSGSNKILELMNRRYSAEEYQSKVDLIREYMPDAGITTDIIVGFPGETDVEFNETCSFVKTIGFSKIHVFKYSKRTGTPAANMKQVDGNIKKVRSDMLIELGEKTRYDFMEGFLKNRLNVLFEKATDDGYIEGYSDNYLRVKTLFDNNFPNQILNLKIDRIEEDFLIGKI